MHEKVTLGEICKHNSLKRVCVTCEAEDTIQAADALAKAAKMANEFMLAVSKGQIHPQPRDGVIILNNLSEKIAAYEKVRAGK